MYVTVYPEVEEFAENRVNFTDGKEAKFDAVILATGYRPRVNFFLNEANVYDEDGRHFPPGARRRPRLIFLWILRLTYRQVTRDRNRGKKDQHRDRQKASMIPTVYYHLGISSKNRGTGKIYRNLLIER